jgi:hypothetical protein
MRTRVKHFPLFKVHKLAVSAYADALLSRGPPCTLDDLGLDLPARTVVLAGIKVNIYQM